MDNPFLPDGYKVPVTGGYYKLQDGENTFRVMTSAVVGFVYWNIEGKPVRSRTPIQGTPADIRLDKEGKPERIKHFWAFAVWNADAQQVQVLELTQKSVMDGIKALVDNKKWGDPKSYDISVTRTGSGLDTEYQVMPNPHSPLPEGAIAALKAKPVNLEALYSGGDVFAPEEVNYDASAGEAHPDEVPA